VGFRVDSVSATMDVSIDFEGRTTIQFTYTPEPDDPLVKALLAKSEEINLKAALAAGPAIISF